MIASLLRFHAFIISDLWLEVSGHFDGSFTLFNTKRISSLVFLYVFINFLIIWNHIGFILDDILFPRWRHEVIREPLFIIGNARSGTTLFHRLVSLKRDTFTSMKLWEILFAVSVTWRIMFHFLFQLDQFYLQGFVYSRIVELDKTIFNSVAMHQFGLFKDEEDEWLMIHKFYSQLILLIFPLGLNISTKLSSISALPAFETLLSSSQRYFIYSYYRDCIKRHLHAYHYLHIDSMNKSDNRHTTSSTIRYVSKNPVFTTRLETIVLLFPDCHFVCMIRDPIQSIPSMVSYISAIWQVFNCPHDKYPKANQLIEFCVQHYTYPLEFYKRGRLRTNQLAFASYQQLVINASDEVLKVLKLLYQSDTGHNDDDDDDDEFKKTLKSQQESIKNHDARHSYSLDECCGGMTETELRALMVPAYTAHPSILS